MRQLLIGTAIVLMSLPSDAADPPFPVHLVDESGANDLYCGLYCVHQAGRLTGRPVDLNALIRPDRLSGDYGSTPQDIVRCCEEFGIPCRLMAKATYLDICFIGVPVILLIKSSPDAPRANHWVLVIDIQSDSAELFDPSFGRVRIPSAELQSLWSGHAIVILQPSDGLEVQIISSIKKIGVIGMAIGLLMFILRALSGMHLHPFLVLTGTSLVVASLAHSIDPAGFLRNGRVLEQIEGVFFPRIPAKLSPAELLAAPTDFVAIDTRTPPQYFHGRLPAATSVPISASYWKKAKILEVIPSGSHVVLYCNNKECTWAETMAKSSLIRRFASVSTLENGVEGYVSAGGVLARGRPQHLE